MDNVSPYMPPRAGRFAWFWRAWYSVSRSCHVGWIRVPVERIARARPISSLGIVLIPILGLYFSALRRFTRLAVGAYFIALFISFAGYGQALGGAAFGLMAGIHGLGIAAYLDAESPADSRLHRVARSVLLTAVVSVLVGGFLNSVIQRFVVPVQGPGGVILINTLSRQSPLVPGELVAYNLEASYAAGLRVGAGTYLGRVLAGSASTIRFTTGQYVLNDTSHDALPFMPPEGEVVAGPGQSLIWPVVFQFSNRYGRTLRGDIVKVDDSALVGRPYKRWFWRTFSP